MRGALVQALFYCWLTATVESTGTGSDPKELIGSADPTGLHPPLKDSSMTCLGSGDEEICCHNCTSCCKDRSQCNSGDDNEGWGNLGSNNMGDFNFANNSKGDCNLEDDSFGIGGPKYSGCPEETWNHIIRFCSLYPYYHKCHSPPHYFGTELADLLAAAVHACDSNIQVKPRPQKVVHTGRRSKRATALQRVKVPRE